MLYGIHDPDLALFLAGQADCDAADLPAPSALAVVAMVALFVTGLCMLALP